MFQARHGFFAMHMTIPCCILSPKGLPCGFVRLCGFFFFFFKSSFRKVRAVRFLLPQFEFRWGLTGSSYLNRALGVGRGLALECEGLQFFSWSSVTTCTEEYESLSQTLTPAEIHDPRAKGPELWLLSEESLTLASGSRLRFVCVLASPPHRDLPV